MKVLKTWVFRDDAIRERAMAWQRHDAPPNCIVKAYENNTKTRLRKSATTQ